MSRLSRWVRNRFGEEMRPAEMAVDPIDSGGVDGPLSQALGPKPLGPGSSQSPELMGGMSATTADSSSDNVESDPWTEALRYRVGFDMVNAIELFNSVSECLNQNEWHDFSALRAFG
jgi:hypothetical protein